MKEKTERLDNLMNYQPPRGWLWDWSYDSSGSHDNEAHLINRKTNEEILFSDSSTGISVWKFDKYGDEIFSNHYSQLSYLFKDLPSIIKESNVNKRIAVVKDFRIPKTNTLVEKGDQIIVHSIQEATLPKEVLNVIDKYEKKDYKAKLGDNMRYINKQTEAIDKNFDKSLNEGARNIILNDRLMDSVTYDDLLTAVESNERVIDEKVITRVFNELLSINIEDARYELKRKMSDMLDYLGQGE